MNISKQTENFIECMKTMQNLYSKVYESLNEIYNAEDTERMIANGFIMEYNALNKRIEKFLIMSIRENIARTDSDEI